MPAMRMRIATAAAHPMTVDAVGGWTVIVASHARQRVPSRHAAVELRSPAISPDPTGWVRIHRARSHSTDPASNVAAVATLGVVATQARGRP